MTECRKITERGLLERARKGEKEREKCLEIEEKGGREDIGKGHG